MTELILHVGPGKCGSSSIQTFFKTEEAPCVQKTHYELLNPLKISHLNCEHPDASLLDSFTETISNNINGCDTLILSHEFLFQNPYSIKNICSLAKNLNIKVSIIGYSRRQSDFMISAYSQWFFRSPARTNEITTTVKDCGLDPLLFTGLENQIIASIINDFYSARQLSEYSILDWYKSYNNVLQLVQDLDAVIKCGVLPGKNSDTSLLQDFCFKSGLTLNSKSKNATQKIANKSFNKDIVEAVNNAVSCGIYAAGPHDDNETIKLLSSKMDSAVKKASNFLLNLKSYIDDYYWESNQKLCKQYELDESYFEPPKSLGKKEIIDIIFHEEHQRSLNKSAIIENYRMLSAKMVALCVELAKDK